MSMLDVRLERLHIGTRRRTNAVSIDAEEDPTSQVQDTELIPAVPRDKEIEVLNNSRPEKQKEAINILMEEEAAVHARKGTLSPNELRKEGHIQYNMVLDSVTGGAVPTMKVLRLKSMTPSTGGNGSSGSGSGGNRYLTVGVNVLILAQLDDSKDKARPAKQRQNTPHARGMISAVGPDYYDIVVAKGVENSLPKDKMQIEGSEMLQVYTRMLTTIRQYEYAEKGFVNVPLLAKAVRGRAPIKVRMDTVFNSVGLNASQKKAMGYALGSTVSLIKGPPGTGKTVVLYQTILELLRRGETVLICCGSHTAVDNLLQRLDEHSREFPIARLGHPHRISASARHLSVDVKRLAVNRGGRSKPPKIIAATLHAACDLGSYGPIHTIVIDEACQALQAQTWIPLLNNRVARRLIVAGDDKQLPPTITTQDSEASKTLDISLFDVFLGCYGEKIMHFLDTQYRMSENIMRFPSDYIYGGLLNAAPKIASQKLYHVPRVTQSPITTPSVLWVDTSSLGYTEGRDRKGLISNQAEATLVKDHCLRLQGQGVNLADIGVISPYVHQKNLLKNMLPAVEIHTVDGFQGQEKSVIVLSLVRSNRMGTVGFLFDERRMNVAITRAKHQLCIVADMRTLSRCTSPMLNEWVEWCERNATVVRPDKRTGKVLSY